MQNTIEQFRQYIMSEDFTKEQKKRLLFHLVDVADYLLELQAREISYMKDLMVLKDD